jgi:hypothetical protein
VDHRLVQGDITCGDTPDKKRLGSIPVIPRRGLPGVENRLYKLIFQEYNYYFIKR